MGVRFPLRVGCQLRAAVVLLPFHLSTPQPQKTAE
jgi:hypothetical protein